MTSALRGPLPLLRVRAHAGGRVRLCAHAGINAFHVGVHDCTFMCDRILVFLSTTVN